jgi:hypothetical protein
MEVVRKKPDRFSLRGLSADIIPLETRSLLKELVKRYFTASVRFYRRLGKSKRAASGHSVALFSPMF